MTNRCSFTPKSHGYGAYPKSWRGWAATLGFIALQLAAALLLIGADDEPVAALRLVGWAGIAAALASGFIVLCRAKTDSSWEWRWQNGEKWDAITDR